MVPYEMDEQLKNLDARVNTIEQILPMLATRPDLRDEVAKLATKEELRAEVAKLATRDELRASQDDLRLTTAALQHEMETGFQEAKAYADRLNEVTGERIRLLDDRMTLVADQMTLVARQMASKEDLRQLHRALSAQIAALGASRSNKKR